MKSKHTLTVLSALITILCIVAVISFGCKNNEEKPDDTTTDYPEIDTQMTTELQTEPETEPITTPAPETTEPVTTPVPETEAPIIGSFSSNTDTNLELVVDYCIERMSPTSRRVQIVITLHHYQLYCGARTSGCSLTVDGNTVKYSTDPISFDGPGENITVLYTYETYVSNEPFEISASWLFNGVYSNTEIDTLEASDTVG